jgi:TolB-like protein/Flp pilus assembly protein TadD
MKYPLPDRPSIAVLPFVNMSGDPKQEYFSDGMTDDLITDLSKISGLMVIARNSTFAYKGKPVTIKRVAHELGVRYILEGSVRRACHEIRINAQLVDAQTGHHLWAERYDGKMSKIFAMQDQITQKIVSALAVTLTGTEKQMIAGKGTNNVEAYDEFLRGWGYYLRRTPDDLAKAVRSFRKAIELDPNYGRAFAALALAYRVGTVHAGMYKGLREASGGSWLEDRLRVGQYLKEATKNPISIAYVVNADIHVYRRQYEEAIAQAQRAVALDPNNPVCHATMAGILLWSCRPKEAVDFSNWAMRLDPHNAGYYVLQLGIGQFLMGNLEEAATLLKKAVRLNPENLNPYAWLPGTFGLLGREKEARAALETFVKEVWQGVEPSLPELMYGFPFKDRAVADRFVNGLIKAGLKGLRSGYFPDFKENQLTEEEIKRLFVGATAIKIFTGGQLWDIDCKDLGDIASRGGDPISFGGGKFRIEGDMICLQYEKEFWGLENCQTVFRNPRGTDEGKDKYFVCSDVGSGTLSVVK